jgi:hypothetical protein
LAPARGYRRLVPARPWSIAWSTAPFGALDAHGRDRAGRRGRGCGQSGDPRRAETLATGNGLRFVAPPLWLCTDNAAMIAWAGIERFAAGLTDPLDIAARPRWPLDPAAEARGCGVKA